MNSANPLERLYWTLFTAWHLRGQSRIPFLPPARLAAIQNRRARQIVAHAWRRVPFYREAMTRDGLRPSDFRTVADLERLPLVSADELARDPERFCARGVRPDQVVTILTSGTTGHRKRVLYDLRYVFLGLAAGQRRRDAVAHVSGIARGARIQEFLMPGNASALLSEAQHRHSFMPRPLEALRRCCSSDVGWDEALRVINSARPEIIHGYATFLGCLFRHAATHGIAVDLPRLLIAHSDAMPQADRELIEEHFGVPVISMYVAAESGFIACQCEQRRAFHIDVDRVAVRVVDEEGRTLPPGGRGEIVTSTLTNRATVLLNYRLGDVVTLSNGPCPCGRTLPTLESIDGRIDSTVLLPDGSERRVWDLFIHLQQTPEAIQLQFRQDAPRHVLLRAVLRPDADREAFRSRAVGVFQEAVGPDVAVDVEYVLSIAPEPGGKVRAVVRTFGQPVAG